MNKIKIATIMVLASTVIAASISGCGRAPRTAGSAANSVASRAGSAVSNTVSGTGSAISNAASGVTRGTGSAISNTVSGAKQGTMNNYMKNNVNTCRTRLNSCLNPLVSNGTITTQQKNKVLSYYLSTYVTRMYGTANKGSSCPNWNKDYYNNYSYSSTGRASQRGTGSLGTGNSMPTGSYPTGNLFSGTTTSMSSTSNGSMAGNYNFGSIKTLIDDGTLTTSQASAVSKAVNSTAYNQLNSSSRY